MTWLYALVGLVAALPIATLLTVLSLIRLEDQQDDRLYGFRMPEQTDPDDE